MKTKITALLLIVSMVATNFSRLFIYAGFELNKNYIATKLCENRDKPWLHCNGHCYLMKKIRAAEDRQNNEERISQKNLFQEAFFIPLSKIGFYNQVLQVIPVPNNRVALPAAHNTIFRPPQLG